MSNYQKGDIVEFINENGLCEFGMIISVQISDTISAIVVSGFSPNRPNWIPTYRVKNHWKNLKGYILDIDLLKAKNKRLKNALREIADLRMLNPNLKESAYPSSCSEDMFVDFYCKMGDIAIKALESTQMSQAKMKGVEYEN